MDKLYILWTNADEIVFEKMVEMYAHNSLLNGWWNNITIIIWGSTVLLAAESNPVRQGIRSLLNDGIHVSACKACSDSLQVTEKLEELGVEVKYWGEDLTTLLKSGEKLLSV